GGGPAGAAAPHGHHWSGIRHDRPVCGDLFKSVGPADRSPPGPHRGGLRPGLSGSLWERTFPAAGHGADGPLPGPCPPQNRKGGPHPMTTAQTLITLGLIAAATALTRFLPFWVFPEGRQPPAWVARLGRVLPAAVIGMLVV